MFVVVVFLIRKLEIFLVLVYKNKKAKDYVKVN